MTKKELDRSGSFAETWLLDKAGGRRKLIEELDADRERAGVIHESLLSRVAEQTNQRMYVLSIIAAIFLPLSFMSGLLGVNVGGIPGMNNELGFSFVILLMLFLAGALWAFFHWRRWF